jgi:hypothetical protein
MVSEETGAIKLVWNKTTRDTGICACLKVRKFMSNKRDKAAVTNECLSAAFKININY